METSSDLSRIPSASSSPSSAMSADLLSSLAFSQPSQSPIPSPTEARPLSGSAIESAKRYLSPSSSAESALSSRVSFPEADMSTRGNCPSTKKCRRSGPRNPGLKAARPPKERLTVEIDMDNLNTEKQAHLDRLILALRSKRKKIVVIAGAGISVSAGIPDFRSSTGLFKTLKSENRLQASGKQLFDASVYKHDSSTESFHSMVRELARLASKAQPTRFHQMLATIAEDGRLLRLYSQNVDCIDTQLPPLATTVPLEPKGPWPRTIQLHGGLEKMVCSKCNDLKPFDGQLFEGPEAPLCEPCKEHDQIRTVFASKRSHGVGRLRPRIVLYNEYNPDEEAIGNVSRADLKRVPDAVVVVGTSLKIPGVRRLVKEMCQLTRSRRDGITAWINTEPEPQTAEFKDCWDLVVRGKCDDVAELVNLPGWNTQDTAERDAYGVSGDEAKEKRMEESLNRCKIKVELPRKRKRMEKKQQPPTPSLSFSLSGEPTSRIVVDLPRRNLGMITPRASPKSRKALPTARPAGDISPTKARVTKPSAASSAEKTKQSTLPFGPARDPHANECHVRALPECIMKTEAKKRGRPRGKSAKAQPPPNNALSSQFRATKSAFTSITASMQEKTKLFAGGDDSSATRSDPPFSTPLPLAREPSVVDSMPSLSLLPSLRSSSPANQTSSSHMSTKQSDLSHDRNSSGSSLSATALSSLNSDTRNGLHPPLQPLSSSGMTVSPPSKPKGLEMMID